MYVREVCHTDIEDVMISHKVVCVTWEAAQSNNHWQAIIWLQNSGSSSA